MPPVEFELAPLESKLVTVTTRLSTMAIRKIEKFSQSYLDYIFRVAPFWSRLEREFEDGTISTEIRHGSEAATSFTRIYVPPTDEEEELDEQIGKASSR